MSSKSNSQKNTPSKNSPVKTSPSKDPEIVEKNEELNDEKNQSQSDTQKLKNSSKLVWTDSTEQLLVKWGDTAACYSWLHDQSFRKFKINNYFFSIPIIILSTITGTLNVGLQSVVPSEYIKLAQIAIGGVNIFTGIITTLQTFFRYAEDSETHFSSSVGWGKLQRNISVELSLERKFRKDAEIFIRQCRTDYDRLLESSPTIPTEIIKIFKDKFKKNTDLIKPDICDEIKHIRVHASDPDPIFEKTNELNKLFAIPEKTLPEITLAVNSVTPGSIKGELENDLTNEDVAKFSNVMRRHSFMNHSSHYPVHHQPVRERSSSDFNIDRTPHNFESTPKPQIKIETNNAPKVRDLIRQFQPDSKNLRPTLLRKMAQNEGENDGVDKVAYKIEDKVEDKVEESKIDIVIVSNDENRVENSKPESKIEETISNNQEEKTFESKDQTINVSEDKEDIENKEESANISQDQKFEQLYLNYGVKLPGLFTFKK